MVALVSGFRVSQLYILTCHTSWMVIISHGFQVSLASSPMIVAKNEHGGYCLELFVILHGSRMVSPIPPALCQPYASTCRPPVLCDCLFWWPTSLALCMKHIVQVVCKAIVWILPNTLLLRMLAGLEVPSVICTTTQRITLSAWDGGLVLFISNFLLVSPL